MREDVGDRQEIEELANQLKEIRRGEESRAAKAKGKRRAVAKKQGLPVKWNNPGVRKLLRWRKLQGPLPKEKELPDEPNKERKAQLYWFSVNWTIPAPE